MSKRSPTAYFYARNFARRLLRKHRRASSLFAPYVAPGDVVYDIGANIGEYTAAFLDLGATVVAVEPQAHLVDYLNRRFDDRASSLRIVQAAATDRPGDVTLRLTSVDALASVDPGFHDRPDAPHQGFRWEDEVVVPGITLDSLVEEFGAPVGLKIDVEGHELAALTGLTLAAPWVFFEATGEFSLPVLDLLVSRGYEMFRFRTSEHAGWASVGPMDAAMAREALASGQEVSDILALRS